LIEDDDGFVDLAFVLEGYGEAEHGGGIGGANGEGLAVGRRWRRRSGAARAGRYRGVSGLGIGGVKDQGAAPGGDGGVGLVGGHQGDAEVVVGLGVGLADRDGAAEGVDGFVELAA